jgi:hypothetical protein
VQANEHVPPVAHVGVPFAVPQTWLHVPQLLVSPPPIVTSQPSPGLPSQSAVPGVHGTEEHEPPEQSAVPPASVEHLFVQFPQWSGSAAVCTSQPSAAFELQCM